MILNVSFQEQIPIQFSIPQATYFAWLKIETNDTEDIFHKKLKAAGVVMARGSKYAADEGVYVRVMTAVPREKLIRGLLALERAYR